MYNIYLDSPQLAVQANRKKQYQKQIKLVNKIQNRPFPKKYGKYYGETTYQRIITYNESNNPGY